MGDEATPVASTTLPRSSRGLGSRRLYLAVDCGGSKAAAAIAISSVEPGKPPSFLSRGFGGAANYTDVGLDRFLLSVREAVENALDEAQIEWRTDKTTSNARSSSQASTFSSAELTKVDPLSANRIAPFPQLFYAAWLGIAGVDSPLNISVLSPHLSRLLCIPYPSSRLIVANDTSLLASPVMERDGNSPPDAVREGVVCIAGTGSIVMSFRSRNQPQPGTSHGATTETLSPGSSSKSGTNSLLEAVGRVGGFGWLLGDEAGGYMVGRKAVRAVLDQADRERLSSDDSSDDDEEEEEAEDGAARDGLGIDQSKLFSGLGRSKGQHLLRDRILAHWNLNSTDDLLDTVYSNDIVVPTSSGPGGQRASVAASMASSVASDSPISDRARKDTTDVDGMELDDPSHSLLPPGARLHPPSVNGGSVSPIPAIDSYPSSPRRQSVSDEGHKGAAATSNLSTTSAKSCSERCLTSQQPSSSALSAALAIPRTATQPPSPASPAEATTAGARKLRLASLAPLVFHLAFTHGDAMSLDLLKGEIKSIVDQIELLLQRPRRPRRSRTLKRTEAAPSKDANGHANSSTRDASTDRKDSRRVLAEQSVLCLGGSLLGVEGYRGLMVDELKARGWRFKRVVHVEDVAKRGCEALARGWEGGAGGE
ncbi:hypothetical protein BDZ90DRAFT_230089 [Jaminaea rosea]|uniref:N-acetyl-D-glucosamine kinase n=1 Tax=Jaminaea rosea TaxID=1569628 RepID=A0A316V4E2_9BASI|nr:hypothetical protein BDZ90DRAFT_230089 [Jaminaea rosea]PWN31093.1 hypothetical protein BDZ90DRAFT_230089 [Jaminaea rosea]